MAITTSPLLERDAALCTVGEAIAAAVARSGRVLLVEGPAGAGKTELLRAVAGAGDGAGMRVLRARGGQLEADLPYGVVRQLFETATLEEGQETLLQGAAAFAGPVVTGRPAPHPAADPAAAIVHGLYWLTAELAARRPLLLLIDDAHWADQPSLRWLAYLVRRLAELPVLCCLAHRPTTDRALAAIATEEVALAVPVPPLTVDGVVTLTAAALSATPEPTFARACHAATGGNPLLVHELLRALRDHGVAPTAAAVARVTPLGASALGERVVERLLHLSDPAVLLARAVAVLAVDAELRHAAALAALDVDTAARAADELAAAHLLQPRRPLEFVHPLVRAAVHDAIPAGERGRLHRTAARLLDDDRALPTAVATHLLATDPAADRWVSDRLAASASLALAEGAVEDAVRYLRRALREPPPAARRWRLLLDLGAAEGRIGDAAAVDHLAEAIALAPDPRARVTAGRELALVCFQNGEAAQAVAALEDALAVADGADRDLALAVQAELISISRLSMTGWQRIRPRLARLAREVTGDSAAERLVLCDLATDAALQPTSADEALRRCLLALGGGRLVQEQTADSMLFYQVVYVLLAADAYDVAAAQLTAAIDDARRRGSVLGIGIAAQFCSMLARYRGELLAAEAEARTSVAAQEQDATGIGVAAASSVLVEVLVERDLLDEADRHLSSTGGDGALPPTVPGRLLRAARAELRLAQGRPSDAIADLEELAALEEGSRVLNPFNAPFRGTLAVARALLGDRAGAVAAAEEQLDLARRWNARRALGHALRVRGEVERPRDAEPWLREAVAVLEPAGTPVELAHALHRLGAALRRAGRTRDARPLLRSSLDLAHGCGALRLAREAAEELRLAGARPRRQRQTGREALTASELRVAQLAAAGLTNREIAQQLFVTLRTVEVHLTHTYQKLGIAGRADLASRL